MLKKFKKEENPTWPLIGKEGGCKLGSSWDDKKGTQSGPKNLKPIVQSELTSRKKDGWKRGNKRKRKKWW